MTLAADILNGTRKASDAIGHPEIYDDLNTSASGRRLPFLGTSSKIVTSRKVGILAAVLYMQPANESGREACAARSEGCMAACLAEKTGRMSTSKSKQARRRRHASFYADRARFLSDLAAEIDAHAHKASKLGMVASVRLNGTTDLPWHRMRVEYKGRTYTSLHEAFPSVRFYEYTKHSLRMQAGCNGLPANLHLTFSVSERTDADARAAEYLAAGYGAAVVTFTKKHDIPTSFALDGRTYGTTDGDLHDARFLDPAGCVVILAAKGRAKHDASGFVRMAA